MDERSPQWFSEHEWRLRDGVLERLQLRGNNSVVVLCGNVFPPEAATELFDGVLHLEVDEETVRERIKGRTDNDYGHTPEEMERILERHRELLAAWRACGVVAVDASRPIAEVAQTVVEAMQQ